MRKYLFALLVLVAAGSTLLVAAFAVAGSGSNKIDAKDGLGGYQEAPSVSTTGSGSFDAEVADDDASFDWTLSYGGMEGSVTQAHIHFAQRHVSGGISIFLCSNLGNGPAGTPPCPPAPATITGTADATDMTNGAVAQGIAAGEFNEILAAIRAGKAYANVHSSKFPGGEIRGQLNDPNER